MIDFLIKSSICLTAFLVFYHLILEREKTHQFNRFYLLISIVISFILPFLTFEIIKIIPAVEEVQTITSIPVAFETTTETIDYTPLVLWSIYGLITLIFFIRFGKNIWKLVSKSNSNPIVKYKNAQLVLVDEKTLPHTFLNSIFINSEDYKHRNIEDELYTHELVHVNQKHTLDILFIELLKTIFWFNPIFIFYKKAIQLNHEFLADEKVVESHNDVSFYQSLLLQKVNGHQTIYLASNLNYLVTKKRLIMMTKSTSKRIALLKKIAIVPILASLIFFICFKVVAQEKANSRTAVAAVAVDGVELGNSPTEDKKRDAYYAGVRIILKDYRKGIKLNEVYENLSLEQKREYLNWIPEPIKEKKLPEELYTKLVSSSKNAVWLNERVINSLDLKNYKATDFKYFTASFIHKNARSKRFPQHYQYHLYTQDYFDKNLKNTHLKFGNDTLKMGISDYYNTKNAKKLKVIKGHTLSLHTKEKQEDLIYDPSGLTEKPDFDGGMTAFYKFIAANYKISEEITKNKIKGKIFAQFIIEKDGSLSNIKILRDMGYGTGEEAERVLKESPKWKPGKMNQTVVRTLYTLPISVSPN